MYDDKAVLARITSLQSMSIADLRAQWLELYKTAAPKTSSPQSLKRRLAYRIQELVYGGDSEETIARLEQKAQALFGSGKSGQQHKAHKQQKRQQLFVGTILTRLYRGVEHQVAVLGDGGFGYNGCKYKSLSAIAKLITGMSWNGLVFFGIKQKASRAA